jgi:hypothetical protein
MSINQYSAHGRYYQVSRILQGMPPFPRSWNLAGVKRAKSHGGDVSPAVIADNFQVPGSLDELHMPIFLFIREVPVP